MSIRLHSPLRENRVAYLGKASAAVRAALLCPNNGVVASVWFLTCARMLMHAIAHEGGTDTVRESALKVDSRWKIPSPHWGLEPSKYCAWLFSRTLYHLSCPRPRDLTWLDLTWLDLAWLDLMIHTTEPPRLDPADTGWGLVQLAGHRH